MLSNRFLSQRKYHVLYDLVPVVDRMTLAELPTGARTTATYDGDGKRRGYADSAGFRGFLWDGENIARETDAGGTTVTAYSYAPSTYGALLSQRRSGTTSFHHGACPERSREDALGSTVQLSAASQSPTDSYLYGAFGEQRVLSGSSPNPFTWVGRLGYYRQPDTSDYWVRARVYGPRTGRWVSRDLVWSDLNRFRYALGSPLVFVDCNGLEAARKLGEQAMIRVVGQSGRAAAPSLFGRAALFAGRLLGPLGLLLTDPGNIMSAEEEAELAAQSHAWPEVAPQPECSEPPRRRRSCCHKRNPAWPWCKYTNRPDVASGKPPQGSAPGVPGDTGAPYDPVGDRAVRQPYGLGRRIAVVRNPGACFGSGAVQIARAVDYVYEQEFRGPRMDPKNVEKRWYEFTVRCCPCCRKQGKDDYDDRQCWNVHGSGEKHG